MNVTEARRPRVRIRLDPEKLRELRLLGGLTQAELGKKAKVSSISIHMYETGQRLNPHPNTTRRISRALGVKPAEILVREEVEEKR